MAWQKNLLSTQLHWVPFGSIRMVSVRFGWIRLASVQIDAAGIGSSCCKVVGLD